jgi:PAS domain S-box-containing protein
VLLQEHHLTEKPARVHGGRNIERLGVGRAEPLLNTGALQSAIFNSANFSSIATDAKGVIQIFNVGAERMLGYTAAEVMNKITPADISDPQEVIARAKALSLELGTPITPGFEALVFKASRGIEDIYELTYIRKDGSRFPAVVSVTALRDAQNAIIGYLLIGTDNTARKRAEAALLKAGALQSAIFNSANFSSIATDAKGVIQIFNVGAEQMLGYSAADVMNKITPADISDPQEVIARARALSAELGTPITPGFEALVFKASRGIEDIYELTYIRKDGSRFPAVVSVTALRDAQNAIIGYLLIGTDNTARKRVEAEQKKLDQRLHDQQFYTRSLIESNIDALMATDPSGIITDVNKQMEALTGCTRDELIGAPFKNYFTDPERAEAAIKLVLSEKKVTDYEPTARARDGKHTVVSYNATTFYDRDRKLQGVFAAARDVTERRRFEQVQLDIIDTVREPLIVLDAEFRVTQANRAFFRTFRVAPEDTIGEVLFTLGDGQWDIAPLRELLRDKLAVEPQLNDFDVDHVFPGIGRKIMLLNARLVSQGPNLPRIILLAIEDITERRFTEWRLADQRRELQRSNAALDEFASVASHDLQEPLRKIVTFGDLLSRSAGPALQSTAREHLARMLNATARMRTLINDLLMYSQVSTRVQLFVDTDLAAIAREVITDLETTIAEAGGRVEVGKLPVIAADPLQMRQLLQNLLGNALKYRRKDMAPVVQLNGSNGGPQCTITVTDNGIGFNEHYAEKIFRMFTRLHGREEYEGSGIGLAICRKIVERHGGTIAATSTTGQGATFTVTLPVTQTGKGYIL